MVKISEDFRSSVPDKDMDGFIRNLIALILPIIVVAVIKIVVDQLILLRVADGQITYEDFSFFWTLRSIILYAVLFFVYAYFVGANLEINHRRVSWIIWLAPISIGLGLFTETSGPTASLDTGHAIIIFSFALIYSFSSYRYLANVQDKKDYVRKLAQAQKERDDEAKLIENETIRSEALQVKNTSISTIDDEHFYKIALDEFEQKKLAEETWAKAITLSKGDESAAKWKYVELRVGRLSKEIRGE